MTDEASTPEQRRIREVYAGYHGRSERWDHANPGNAAIERERLDVIEAALRRRGLPPLAEARVLDIGCGDGLVLGELVDRGLQPARAVGIDLLEDRIDAARHLLPEARFEVQDASGLSEADGVFDYVVLFTVLSSVLDADLRAAIVRETARVLRAGGAVMFYDMRVPNPQNRQVTGIRQKELARLFAGYALDLRPVTVVPQLARKLGNRSSRLYPLLARSRGLCTHLAGVITAR